MNAGQISIGLVYRFLAVSACSKTTSSGVFSVHGLRPSGFRRGRFRFGCFLGAFGAGIVMLHYSPKHGSWLNQAEIEISLFSRRCLGSRSDTQLNPVETPVLGLEPANQ